MIKKLLLTIFALACGIALLIAFLLWRQGLAAGDPTSFEDEILVFEAADAQQAPLPGGIVFTGSSSIRFWRSLTADMSPLRILQRGFGGAHMEHVVHNIRRIIIPYAPRAVVVFVGGNDLGSGKSADDLIDDFKEFVDIVQTELPQVDVWLLSMKPSPLRWEKWPEMIKVDAALESMAQENPRIFFVPTGRTLLDEGGTPGDFYIFDGLHLNQDGYDRWTELLRPRLLESYGPFPPGPSS